MDLFIGLVIGILLGAGIVYFLISTSHGKTNKNLLAL